MFTRFAGAVIRAGLVAFLILYPGMVLSQESQVAINLFGFLALIGGAIVWIEYAFSSPNLIEFRFCPPFNRLRYGSLMLLLVLLVYLYPDRVPTSKLYLVSSGLSKLCLYLWNFQYSPVPVLAVALGSGDPALTVHFARMAALALTISILYAAIYAIASRGFRTHLEARPFNYYLNLPTTTLSEGTIPRVQLRAIAVLSLVVALTLPLVVPIYLLELSGMVQGEPLAQRPMVVWTIALWAWVPAIAFLRGVAFLSIARNA